MKAIEYFAKYDDKFFVPGRTLPECQEIAKELFSEFHLEAIHILDRRNVKTNEGALSVIRELNQKWNVLAGLFEEKYRLTPIRYDGFQRVWDLEFLELTAQIPNGGMFR